MQLFLFAFITFFFDYWKYNRPQEKGRKFISRRGKYFCVVSRDQIESISANSDSDSEECKRFNYSRVFCKQGANGMFSLQLLTLNQSSIVSQFSITPSYAQSSAYAAILVNSSLQTFSGTMQFVIVASNTNSAVMRSSSATVTITVQPYVTFPLFSQTYYSFILSENATSGTLIGYVSVCPLLFASLFHFPTNLGQQVISFCFLLNLEIELLNLGVILPDSRVAESLFCR